MQIIALSIHIKINSQGSLSHSNRKWLNKMANTSKRVLVKLFDFEDTIVLMLCQRCMCISEISAELSSQTATVALAHPSLNTTFNSNSCSELE